jgi:integrase
MPLRIRRRKDTGALEIYGTVRPAGAKVGVRVRERAGSDDEATAREEAIAREREILRNIHLGQRPDSRSFAEACRSYINHETRSTRTLQATLRVLRYFGTMRLDQINQEAVDNARGVVLRQGASSATVARNLIVPLRAVMTHASRRGWCTMPAFDVPSIDRRRPDFLLPHQVEALITAAAPHLQPLLRFLVCTGCRLSEALTLEWRSVDLAGARVTLWEGETKGGKRRVICLVAGAVAALHAVGHRTGCVFLTARKQPYRSSDEYGGQIKTAWARACRLSDVSGGVHMLRHTWASYHYALNRDPLQLMRDGGWSGLALVERYAHLLPAGHEDGVRRVWGLDVARELRA